MQWRCGIVHCCVVVLLYCCRYECVCVCVSRHLVTAAAASRNDCSNMLRWDRDNRYTSHKSLTNRAMDGCGTPNDMRDTDSDPRCPKMVMRWSSSQSDDGTDARRDRTNDATDRKNASFQNNKSRQMGWCRINVRRNACGTASRRSSGCDGTSAGG